MLFTQKGWYILSWSCYFNKTKIVLGPDHVTKMCQDVYKQIKKQNYFELSYAIGSFNQFLTHHVIRPPMTMEPPQPFRYKCSGEWRPKAFVNSKEFRSLIYLTTTCFQWSRSNASSPLTPVSI